jgi:transposase
LRVVREKRISIKELKKLIFGARTEKTQKVLKSAAQEKPNEKNDASRKKRKGHGRNGSDAYTGAERVCLQCSEVRPGDRCPECGKGKLYLYKPSEIVCIRGQAPIQATVYEQERLRCNLCGAWFKAAAPEQATGPKYDPSSAGMMGLLHYGCGFPFNRLEALQSNLGIPLPSSTQWDVLNSMAHEVHPVFEAINRQAAQGEIFHNDDTKGRVLALEKQIAEEIEACRARGEECRHVLETLREIYKNDAFAKEQGLSKDDRLTFHQQNSKPIMDAFFAWLNARLQEKRIEPNSRMGGAIKYMLKHWQALTLFLRVPGSPLDNNICERALKTPIRHRNNSLFFKTERGALVGDVFMSLIHTCRLNGVNAFEYLHAIAQYARQAAAAPKQWLPWNYRDQMPRSASP